MKSTLVISHYFKGLTTELVLDESGVAGSEHDQALHYSVEPYM